MPSNSVSVIIPAYNSGRTIARAIDAVLDQDHPGNIEIIVVNDGSKDNTAQIVKSYHRVKYIYQENSGPATARNKGAEASRGDFLCFTDSDCIPEPDWVKNLVGSFSDPSIAVVSGSYGMINNDSVLARCIHKEIVFRHQELMPSFPKSFGSYNFCVRRKVFVDVGGFDTKYRNASGEDNDLSYKIMKSGYKIFFDKKAIVNHHHTTSVKKYLKEQYQHGFWRAKIYIDHPKMSRGDDYTFWKDIVEIPAVYLIILSIFLSLFGWPLLGFGHTVLLFLIILELCYAQRMTGAPRMTTFFGSVMLLRAFARALGFASGIIVFSLNFLSAKK